MKVISHLQPYPLITEQLINALKERLPKRAFDYRDDVRHMDYINGQWKVLEMLEAEYQKQQEKR